MNEESKPDDCMTQKNSWSSNPLERAYKSWKGLKEKYEAWMFDNGIEYTIDEFALIFPDKELLVDWIEDAVRQEGVSLFNMAHDRVHTHPFCTDYGVEYWFLKDELAPWRVEAMVMRHGVSPLHAGILENMTWQRMPRLVHLSFKVPDEQAYEDVTAYMEEAGAVHAQGCDSTYGTFSYWRVPASEVEDEAFVYLKPRVNRRDQPISPETTSDEDKATHEDRGDFGMPGVGINFEALAKQPRGFA